MSGVLAIIGPVSAKRTHHGSFGTIKDLYWPKRSGVLAQASWLGARRGHLLRRLQTTREPTSTTLAAAAASG